MAKTRRLISENLKLVDTVIILLDARIPISSQNPEIDSLVKNKSSITVLNKYDMADPQVSSLWQEYYKSIGKTCIFVDSIRGTGFQEVARELREINKPLLEKEKARGRIFRPIRTMVVGIPNVGKSSFINKIAGRAVAITGNKPGVTRGKQWIRLNREIELLDTPGILWPKFNDRDTALNLAYTGAIKDEILDIVELAASLAAKLSELYPASMEKRYKIKIDRDNIKGIEILEQCARNRGCFVKGGEIDYYRMASILLDEFRSGVIDKITLERPADIEKRKNRKDED